MSVITISVCVRYGIRSLENASPKSCTAPFSVDIAPAMVVDCLSNIPANCPSPRVRFCNAVFTSSKPTFPWDTNLNNSSVVNPKSVASCRINGTPASVNRFNSSNDARPFACTLPYASTNRPSISLLPIDAFPKSSMVATTSLASVPNASNRFAAGVNSSKVNGVFTENWRNSSSVFSATRADPVSTSNATVVCSMEAA